MRPTPILIETTIARLDLSRRAEPEAARVLVARSIEELLQALGVDEVGQLAVQRIIDVATAEREDASYDVADLRGEFHCGSCHEARCLCLAAS